MSEKILQALMQLFAIGAALERLTLQSRSVVESFLRQQVSLQRVDEYLRIFDDFMQKFSGTGDDITRARKKIAFSSVRALRICTEINKELNTRQKYIVFLRLAEFMQSSELEITEPEKEFLETVANVFNISPEESSLIQTLASPKSTLKDFDSGNVLIVSNRENIDLRNAHQLLHDELDGMMIFVYLKDASIFFLSYRGLDSFIANGQPIDSNRSTVITQGAVLRCSRLKPIYYRDIIRPFLTSGEEDTFQFTAKDLDFVFSNGKHGLHKINFTINSGNLTGIMGGSGAGKSTLLNVLNGSMKLSSGEILINGKNIYEGDIAEGLIGNIPQDDLLIEELSVYQNLFYNTKLCFGELTDEAINTKVLDVLDSLGLAEIKDLKVGSVLNKTISGGQRKRLNIGLELVREPSILFVDEPTSGLSSRDAENVMDLLKQLALSGKLIFVVIHQPSSDIFRLFDQLFILDTGGYPVYFGNPADALIYFKRQVHLTDAEQSECSVCGNINPEQLFNIIELHEVDEFGKSTGNRKITPKEWNQLFLNSSETIANPSSHLDLNVKKNKKAGAFAQWKIFFTRDLLSRLSNKQYLMINLLEAPVLALILGFILRYSAASNYELISNPNLPAFLFISVIVSLFMGLSVSAEEIIRDRKIRQREKFLNLSKTSYFLSKVTLLFMISAIQTLSFLLIGNAVMGIHDMNLTYWLILFTTSCFANLLGLNISAALDSAVTVYILIPFLLIPQILLSGVIVRYDKLHPLLKCDEGVPLIGNVMTSRWAYEALTVEQYANNPFEKQFYDADAIMSQATYKKDFWLAEMREKIDRLERFMIYKSNVDSINVPLTILHNEFNDEPALNSAMKSQLVSQLNSQQVNQGTITLMRSTLEELRNHYIDKYNEASESKEAKITQLTSGKNGNDEFLAMKNRYENESLEEFVRNSNQKEKLVVTNEKIVQRFEPIYHQNPKENFTKAPMFSYSKMVFGKKMKTLCLNMTMIWLMSLLLYFMLQLDIFRKVIGLFSRTK